ncbi:MAG: gfo/Idh/MocA family oxidoreductase, partial [Caldilineaceae bacterium]|nr:gfo/Idh/MocA family oxidoreductase [Caldilineaceae bacterium]
WYHSQGDLAVDSTPDLQIEAFRQRFVHQVGDVYADPQSHWIAGLQGRVDLLPTADIALNCMLISEGIYLSSRLEREVMAEEVQAASVSTAVSI